MVSRAGMASMAARHDTLVAYAFLRALGMTRAEAVALRDRSRRERARYAHARECFENRERIGYRAVRDG